MSENTGNEASIDASAPHDPADVSDWFWSIVDSAHQDRPSLERILETLPDEEVIHFALEFQVAAGHLRGESYTKHLMYRSEDNIDDLSYWVVAQGKSHYLTVRSHPEMIAADENDDAYDRTLAFAAEDVLTRRLASRLSDNSYPQPDGYEIVHNLTEDFARSPYHRVSDFLAARQNHAS